MVDRSELRDELMAVTSASRELSDADHAYLVEGFVNRLDAAINARIDARVDERLSSTRRAAPSHSLALTAVVLTFAIPLSAAAAAFAHAEGLVVTWAAILAVVWLSTRHQ